MQCLRKEVEEEVYKSLVNKRLAAGEVILIFETFCSVSIFFTLIVMIIWKHLCWVLLLAYALMTYFDL